MKAFQLSQQTHIERLALQARMQWKLTTAMVGSVYIIQVVLNILQIL